MESKQWKVVCGNTPSTCMYTKRWAQHIAKQLRIERPNVHVYVTKN